MRWLRLQRDRQPPFSSRVRAKLDQSSSLTTPGPYELTHPAVFRRAVIRPRAARSRDLGPAGQGQVRMIAVIREAGPDERVLGRRRQNGCRRRTRIAGARHQGQIPHSDVRDTRRIAIIRDCVSAPTTSSCRINCLRERHWHYGVSCAASSMPTRRASEILHVLVRTGRAARNVNGMAILTPIECRPSPPPLRIDETNGGDRSRPCYTWSMESSRPR